MQGAVSRLRASKQRQLGGNVCSANFSSTGVDRAEEALINSTWPSQSYLWDGRGQRQPGAGAGIQNQGSSGKGTGESTPGNCGQTTKEEHGAEAQHTQPIELYISKKVAAGKIIGPVPADVEGIHASHFGIIPKPHQVVK